MAVTKKDNTEQTPEIINETTSTETKGRRKAVQIDRNEMIPCRSIVYGNLTYKSMKTGLINMWDNYGSLEYVEYSEILTMLASQPKFIKKPWIIIEDDEVVSTISGLKEIYDNISKMGDDFEKFFDKKYEEFKEIFIKLPYGTKDLLANKAKEMIESGKLYDLRKIKVIDECMKIGLTDLIK